MNTLSGSFTPSKKPAKKVVVDNPFETFREEVVNSVKNTSADTVKDMWAQIMGTDKYASQPQSKAGELKAGQELNLKDAAKKNEQKPTQETPMSYFKEIREAGKAGIQKEAAEIKQQVEAIIYELQKLATASKAIEKQVAQAIGTGLVNPGTYHAAFFEWMLAVVSTARKRVENAGTWLTAVSKKKGAMKSLKKNMNQLMSGERSTANQTG